MATFFMAHSVSGLLLTLGAYCLGDFLYQKTKWTLLQPILTASVMIILLLTCVEVPYEVYYEQNHLLNEVLPLTAVVLAVPLYRNLHLLRRYALPIIAGIVSGTMVTMAAIVGLGKLLGTDLMVIISMLPKSATNPIALEVSDIIGGIPSFTVALVVITGMFGGVLGPELLNLFRVKHDVARGIALGSMSHAIGTARAYKENEVQGSMSSLAMAIAGILTAVLAPIFASFL